MFMSKLMDDELRKERTERIREILVPLVFLLAIVVFWAMVIYVAATDMKYRSSPKTFVADAIEHNEKIYIRLPANRANCVWSKYIVSSNLVKNGKVTVYYMEDKGTWYIPLDQDMLMCVYAIGILMTVLIVYWNVKVIFRKKHAVRKENAQSSKDN